MQSIVCDSTAPFKCNVGINDLSCDGLIDCTDGADENEQFVKFTFNDKINAFQISIFFIWKYLR